MQDAVWNIIDFKSVQEAVDACDAAGGGMVLIPNGEWHTNAIHLRSNVKLHLEEDAVLVFSDKFEDYLPVVFTRWEGTECYNYSPLIYARDCENIAVTGKGKLIGNGQAWWHWKKLQQTAAEELGYAEYHGIPVEQRVYGTEEAALRPSFIQTIHCKNVLLEGFTIEDGPQWTLHPVYCEDVVIRDVTVLTHGPNTDGLNPDSCKNVLVEGCYFDTGDDCVAINSGLNEDGWRVNKSCENVEIRNCTMRGGHGAVVIGSAMSGGVRQIHAHHCQISGTMQGIRLKSMRGRGGYVDDVVFEEITINDVSDQAVQINMFYEFSTIMPKTDTPSDFRNITFRNIRGRNVKTGVQMIGLPERKLGKIVLENIELTAENAFVCSDVEDICIKNVQISEKQNGCKIPMGSIVPHS